MKLISEEAVIIHNIIVDERRGGYTSDGAAGRSVLLEIYQPLIDAFFTQDYPETTPLSEKFDVKVSDSVKVKGMHRDQLPALIDHQWLSFGKNRYLYFRKYN